MRLGTALSVRNPLPELFEQARLVDALGYDSVWVPEVRGRDAFTTCALLVPHVATARLATGIVPLPLRSPVVVAMGAAALAEATAGRFILGVGRGHVETTGPWYGAGRPLSLAETRASLALIGGILRTGEASGDVTFRLDGAYPPAPPPILLAATGPRSAALGGAAADGVVLNWVSPAGAARLAGAAREGAERAGRDPAALEIASFLPVCVTGDRAAAAVAFSRQVAAYGRLAAYRGAMTGSGFAAEAARVAAGEPVPPALLDRFGAFGDEATVRAALDELAAAGVTLPVLAPFPAGDDQWGSLLATWTALAPR